MTELARFPVLVQPLPRKRRLLASGDVITINMANRVIIHLCCLLPYSAVVPEIWRELIFLCTTGPFVKGPGIMLASPEPAPAVELPFEGRGMFLREARPEV